MLKQTVTKRGSIGKTEGVGSRWKEDLLQKSKGTGGVSGLRRLSERKEAGYGRNVRDGKNRQPDLRKERKLLLQLCSRIRKVDARVTGGGKGRGNLFRGLNRPSSKKRTVMGGEGARVTPSLRGGQVRLRPKTPQSGKV